MARRPISLDEFEKMEVGDNNQLFWAGNAVVLDKPFSLATFERWLAVAAAGSAVVLAVIETLRFFGIGH